ncbi:hypothetical protein AUP41_20010 [Thalassospira xiamenensis]|nr:hypothetical protein AUP41_20010 [Thalassospira xiamenensis]
MPLPQIATQLFLGTILLSIGGCLREPTISEPAAIELLEQVYTLPDPNFMAFHDPLLRRSFFTEEIADLIDAKEACYEQAFGLSHLDFDYIVPGQDYSLDNLQISQIGQSGNQTVLLVRFENFGEKVDLLYNLQRTHAGWRIADTIYGKFSLKSDLSIKCQDATP